MMPISEVMQNGSITVSLALYALLFLSLLLQALLLQQRLLLLLLLLPLHCLC